MSDDIPDRSSTPEDTKPAEKPSRKPLFSGLNADLKQALDTWDTLTEEMSHKMSPEEEQLREVKRLLGELKSKLKQFDE